ncbi:CynX/NimT family MFS transporter [Noviherbaspirillum massiliense]|uniref:CynX/NimT family MFS transporter n=1 Tax=Noviherbaspirillum massiliense TaxID=1465823 RepID=UPI00031E7FD3|nr:CynX/NimT family MFS transporter [Noviherbaspirillum massiliense]
MVHKDGPSPSSALDAKAEPLPSEHSRWYLLFALFLVGINLRPALSSVAPVLAIIRDSIGLSSTGAGLLTTLPVLCFGLFAPLAPRLANRLGAERTVFLGLLVLAASLGLRVFGGIPGMFFGTLVVGASIGVIMILLPGIIKRDFAQQAGSMTGVYTMALCLGAALSAGLTVPLEKISGNSWRAALAFWLLPAVVAAAAWWPHARDMRNEGAGRQSRVQGLRSNALAWQVTAYMGLQSALAYCVFGWLPTILIERGMSPLTAGGILSLSIALQLVTALGGPWLASRLGRDQRPSIALMMALSLVGYLGCIYAGLDAIWFWAILLGLGQGGSFSIGLTLIVLRAPNPAIAASLSAMVQGIGYTGAALGPLAFGLLRDLSHDWNAATEFFVVVCLGALIAGMGAGRNRYVTAAAA